MVILQGCIGDHCVTGAVVSPWCTLAVCGGQYVDRYRTDGVVFMVGWATCSVGMVVGLPNEMLPEGGYR